MRTPGHGWIASLTPVRGDLSPVNLEKLGWQPFWNEERLLASLKDEIEAAVSFVEATTTAFDALRKP